MKFQLTQDWLDRIDQYIKGELEGAKLSAFEKELETNAPLKEEMLLQKQLFNSIESQDLDPDSRANFEDDELSEKVNSLEYQAVSKKIRQLGIEFDLKPEEVKNSLWVRFRRFVPAAAAILVLVVMSTVYIVNNNPSLDQYYTGNVNWNSELPSFTEKGDSKSEFSRAEAYFNAKDYTNAILAFEAIDEYDELYPYSLMYLGASYANLNQDQQALQVFERLAEMKEFGESSKGLWYAAMIHLKEEDEEKAMEVLKEIARESKNYRYEDALRIVKELE